LYGTEDYKGFVNLIAEQNQIDPNKIKPGDKIEIDFNLLPEEYKDFITQTKTLTYEEIDIKKRDTLSDILADYLVSHGIASTSSILYGEDGLVKLIAKFNGLPDPNKIIPGRTVRISPEIVKDVLLNKAVKNYIGSLEEIGRRYASGESAYSISQDYAVSELQDLNNIRALGLAYARQHNLVRSRFDSRAYPHINLTEYFKNLYQELGSYRKVQERVRKELLTNISRSTLSRYIKKACC
jgi:hypothetical protein